MNDRPKVWINNTIVPWEAATVPILSHGFSRGSAVFEVFGTHVGPDGVAAFRMDDHLKRLAKTVALLDMEMKYTIEEIAGAVFRLAHLNRAGRGIVKIMAFWGEEAVIDLVPAARLDVAVFTVPASDDLVLDSAAPITACLSRWRKLHPETIPVQAKACANYLNGYLVRKDAMDRGFDIGLNVGTDGFVAEGSIESLFIVRDGVIKTPPLGRILASVTRDSIVTLARREGLPMEETILMCDDLLAADEMFTSHTGIKVSPVKQFEDRELPAPGPVTRRISQLMDDVLGFRDAGAGHWFQRLY